jgi:hypothetical protein
MKSLRSHVVSVLIAAVVIGALLGLASATAKSSSGRAVQACVAGTSGAVRFVGLGRACHKGESSLLLNQVGAQGANGKTGKTGKTGAIGAPGGPGAVGPTGPAGPANAEVVFGPLETVSGGDQSDHPTGETAVSTASCSSAVNSANVDAYGGGVNVVTNPSNGGDVVEVQSSYPGEATGPTGATSVTGPLGAEAAQASVGQTADAWTGVAVVDLLHSTAPDTATVQTYVDCGP